MASWVKIATEALHCEWPTFEAVRAFSVFQLKPRLAPAEIRKDLKKICTIFSTIGRLCVILSDLSVSFTLPLLLRGWGPLNWPSVLP